MNINSNNNNNYDVKSVMTQNSKVTQNTHITNANQNVTDLTEESEFILIDTREEDEFDNFHIV